MAHDVNPRIEGANYRTVLCDLIPPPTTMTPFCWQVRKLLGMLMTGGTPILKTTVKNAVRALRVKVASSFERQFNTPPLMPYTNLVLVRQNILQVPLYNISRGNLRTLFTNLAATSLFTMRILFQMMRIYAVPVSGIKALLQLIENLIKGFY